MTSCRVIALLLNSAGLRDDYQGHLRRGVEMACIDRDIGLWVYAGRTDGSPSSGAQLRGFRILSAERIDGLIVAAGCIASSHSIHEILSDIRCHCDVPLVVVGQRCDGMPSLVVDNYSATLLQPPASQGSHAWPWMG